MSMCRFTIHVLFHYLKGSSTCWWGPARWRHHAGFFLFFFLFMIIWLTAEVIEKPRGVRKSAHTSRERERNWTIGHLNTHTRPLASSRSTAGFETYNLVEFAFGSRKKKKTTTTTKEAMASSHGKHTPLDITDEEKNSKYNLPGSFLGFWFVDCCCFPPVYQVNAQLHQQRLTSSFQWKCIVHSTQSLSL